MESFSKTAERREPFRRSALSSDYQARTAEPEDSYRPPYRRDVDRILHSKAYARYVDKTQVVYLVANDHISHRALHVQLVSSLSRGIAEVLGLNRSLVEAIALGHDVGHPPFGHEGEGYLSKISHEWQLGTFTHPWQSCRLLSTIEPLNLGLAVYDGILCHDGGMATTRWEPQWGKTWSDHQRELDAKLKDPHVNLMPMTLEGCLVKICDTVSYLSRDIEDAISLGIIDRQQLPDTTLGKHHHEILKTVAEDIIRHSLDKEYIALSDQVYDAVMALRRFNFDYIYFEPRLKRESSKIQRSYDLLCHFLFDDLLSKKEKSYTWTHFLHNKSTVYHEQTSPQRQVIDYVAGMTDGFFIRTIEKIFVPMPIGLTC